MHRRTFIQSALALAAAPFAAPAVGRLFRGEAAPMPNDTSGAAQQQAAQKLDKPKAEWRKLLTENLDNAKVSSGPRGRQKTGR